MKLIAKKENKRGITYAIAKDGDTFGVWKLCENYCHNVNGGIAKSWRYVEKGLTEETALALFNRRSA